jgi:hypothetical protein
MDKVYRGCMLVDENELDTMMYALFNELVEFEYPNNTFNEIVKVYVKLLKEKDDIQHERAKHESQTETESI